MNHTGDEGRRRGKRSAASEDSARPFEDDLAELDEIVATLEEGKLPLDEALTLYERGVRLTQACQRRLDEAALRVSQLREAGNREVASEYILESIEFDAE
jgi:exodeoxyribonuclease VII small subunit